jgi:S-adenosyl methyltransferase
MTSSDRSGALPPDTSEPIRPGTSPKPPSSRPALQLAASYGEPALAAPTDPDRLHSRCAPQFDPTVPHPARVYGYWLGGKDHFPADRQAAEEVMRLRPQVVASARANRYFLARVVRYLAGDCGIRQFLDIGVGLPDRGGNTHEIAQRAAPDSKIVYCDNDPLVLVHARALLASATPQGACGYVDADLHEPETILAGAARTLNFTQPAAILLLAVLHFMPDAAGSGEIVAALASALAPGSYLAISHLTGDFGPEQVAAATAAYNNLAPVPVTARTHAQVTALFGRLPLLAPGVVPVTEWRPEVADPFGQPADLHGGVARIPLARVPAGGLV